MSNDLINKTAKEIVSMEAVCIEWGAPAKRSVELVEEKLRELLAANPQTQPDYDALYRAIVHQGNRAGLWKKFALEVIRELASAPYEASEMVSLDAVEKAIEAEYKGGYSSASGYAQRVRARLSRPASECHTAQAEGAETFAEAAPVIDYSCSNHLSKHEHPALPEGCDYRKAGCSELGKMINGTWRCKNHEPPAAPTCICMKACIDPQCCFHNPAPRLPLESEAIAAFNEQFEQFDKGLVDGVRAVLRVADKRLPREVALPTVEDMKDAYDEAMRSSKMLGNFAGGWDMCVKWFREHNTSPAPEGRERR